MQNYKRYRKTPFCPLKKTRVLNCNIVPLKNEKSQNNFSSTPQKIQKLIAELKQKAINLEKKNESLEKKVEELETSKVISENVTKQVANEVVGSASIPGGLMSSCGTFSYH